MRKKTVKIGLNLLLAGIVWIILATFYHVHVARLLLLSPGAEIAFVLIGFVAGGVCALGGILVTSVGLISRSSGEKTVTLSYTMIFLAASLIIYFFLFYMSLRPTPEPDLMPGETITI